MRIENNILVKVENSDIENGTFIVPGNVTEIGEFVFDRCLALKTVVLSNNLISIGYGAFNGCSFLKTINIPNNVSKIEGYAFFNCSALETIKIPNSVTEIGIGAFHDCKSLKTITISNNLISIKYGAFRDCDLQSKEGKYKAFNKGLQCKDMQYKPYEWNEINGKIVMCENGLHYVTNLFDIFNYYSGNLEEDLEIWEVEPGNIIINNDDDSKKATNKIKPIRKLSRIEIINILNNK